MSVYTSTSLLQLRREWSVLDRIIAGCAVEVLKDALLAHPIHTGIKQLAVNDAGKGRVAKGRGAKKEKQQKKRKRKRSIPALQDMGQPPKRCWKRRTRTRAQPSKRDVTSGSRPSNKGE